MPNKTQLNDLRRIPGVGPRIAEDLTSIGIRAVTDLKGKDPEKLYQQLCRRVGKPVDRCMLYVFRCAVDCSRKRGASAGKRPWSGRAVAQMERHTKRTLFEVFFTSNSLSFNAHLLSL